MQFYTQQPHTQTHTHEYFVRIFIFYLIPLIVNYYRLSLHYYYYYYHYYFYYYYHITIIILFYDINIMIYNFIVIRENAFASSGRDARVARPCSVSQSVRPQTCSFSMNEKRATLNAHARTYSEDGRTRNRICGDREASGNSRDRAIAKRATANLYSNTVLSETKRLGGEDYIVKFFYENEEKRKKKKKKINTRANVCDCASAA